MKKFVINRVDLGQRVTGYEVFCPDQNGGEVLGYTPKQMQEAISTGEVYGLIVDDAGDVVPDTAKGFRSIMVKTGIGTLNNPDTCAMTNILYTAYGRQGEDFKVISSRFGRQVFCLEKVATLMDLAAVNGVMLVGDKFIGAWEAEAPQGATSEAAGDKKKGG